jgi:hypothetical protein
MDNWLNHTLQTDRQTDRQKRTTLENDLNNKKRKTESRFESQPESEISKFDWWMCVCVVKKKSFAKKVWWMISHILQSVFQSF